MDKPMCEYLVDGNKLTCSDLFNCCDCGGNDGYGCGCAYCFSCHACDVCMEDNE